MSTNMFLKLEKKIEGECADEKHAGWIEILSWSHSFEQPATNFRASTGSTLEKCKHELLTFQKYIDKATPEILKTIWSGKQLDTGEIHCYRSDGENVPVQYLKILMDDVIISSYSISGGEGDIPQEDIGLSYSKITYFYTPMDKLLGTPDSGGAIPASQDLITNITGAG